MGLCERTTSHPRFPAPRSREVEGQCVSHPVAHPHSPA
uniref:Uncharacterized protein n=1 Tax=Anguilla anguilla TaxID=7936 RepID=A0A0E9SA89_ANGAN